MGLAENQLKLNNIEFRSELLNFLTPVEINLAKNPSKTCRNTVKSKYCITNIRNLLEALKNKWRISNSIFGNETDFDKLIDLMYQNKIDPLLTCFLLSNAFLDFKYYLLFKGDFQNIEYTNNEILMIAFFNIYENVLGHLSFLLDNGFVNKLASNFLSTFLSLVNSFEPLNNFDSSLYFFSAQIRNQIISNFISQNIFLNFLPLQIVNESISFQKLDIFSPKTNIFSFFFNFFNDSNLLKSYFFIPTPFEIQYQSCLSNCAINLTDSKLEIIRPPRPKDELLYLLLDNKIINFKSNYFLNISTNANLNYSFDDDFSYKLSFSDFDKTISTPSLFKKLNLKTQQSIILAFFDSSMKYQEVALTKNQTFTYDLSTTLVIIMSNNILVRKFAVTQTRSDAYINLYFNSDPNVFYAQNTFLIPTKSA